MFANLVGNEKRTQNFITGFNERFKVQTSFTTMDSLRDQAAEYGERYNVFITIFSSLIEEGKIKLHCKHGSGYRAAKS